jgi:hypothetical protein
MRLRTLPLLAALVLVLVPAATAVAAPGPFGTHACVPQDGVRFCPGTLLTRVKTFDGVPLDADVALPATGRHRAAARGDQPRLGSVEGRLRGDVAVGRPRLRGARVLRARLRRLMG